MFLSELIKNNVSSGRGQKIFARAARAKTAGPTSKTLRRPCVAKSWHAFRRFRCHSNGLHGHSKHPDDEVRRKIMSRLHFRDFHASMSLLGSMTHLLNPNSSRMTSLLQTDRPGLG